MPGVSLTNGPMVRATSRWRSDSSRITVAPKSAITRVVAGPAMAHVKSSTFTPSRGRRRSPLPFVAAGAVTAGERGASPRTSAVCSPRRGARPRSTRPTRVECTIEPGVRTGRSDSSASSTWSKNSRASNCALCTTSSGVATGAMSRPRERAASSSSAFVLLRQNSADDALQPLVLLDRLAAVVELVGVVEPVLVARRLVAVALLVDPVHEPAAERAHRRAEQERDRGVAVLARPEELDVEPARLHAAALALRLGAAEGHGQHVALRGLQHRPLRRHRHVLAEAAVGPLGQGHHGAGGGVGAGVEEGLGHDGADRRPVVVTGHGQLAAGGHDRQVGGGPAGLRTRLAERA